MSRIVGIDLGTTNSLVAYVEGGIPRVIPDAEGRALLPSIVAWTPNGVVVGEAARRQLARNASRTVYSVKRLMGRGYEDVKDELARLPFAVTPQAEVVTIRIGDALAQAAGRARPHAHDVQVAHRRPVGDDAADLGRAHVQPGDDLPHSGSGHCPPHLVTVLRTT